MTGTEKLRDTIRDVHSSTSLSMLAVVSRDGLILESESLPDVDAEAIAAVAAPGLMMMDGLSQELGEQDARITTLEFENSIVTMAPLNDEYLLLMVSEPGAMNLGQSRLILSRTVNSVREGFDSI